jgi:hypothetical protein
MLENHLMKTSTKSRGTLTKAPSSDTPRMIPDLGPPTPRPSGKLGLIIDRLAAKRGATAEELVEATGWQRHSVLGALSRLKARGFDFHLGTISGRKVYRLQKD